MISDYFICHCANRTKNSHDDNSYPLFSTKPLHLPLSQYSIVMAPYSLLLTVPPPLSPTSYNSFIDRLFSTTIVETLKHPNLYCNSFVCINRMKSLVSSEDILASLLHCLRNTTFKAGCSFLLFYKYRNCFALNSHI